MGQEPVDSGPCGPVLASSSHLTSLIYSFRLVKLLLFFPLLSPEGFAITSVFCNTSKMTVFPHPFSLPFPPGWFILPPPSWVGG